MHASWTHCGFVFGDPVRETTTCRADPLPLPLVRKMLRATRTNEEKVPMRRRKPCTPLASRKYMTMVSILVAGVTYQAGLTPPGGVWPESTDGHAADNLVLHDTNKRRYRLFFDSKSVSFLTSLLVILLILQEES
jgi:hypothetical protein